MTPVAPVIPTSVRSVSGHVSQTGALSLPAALPALIATMDTSDSPTSLLPSSTFRLVGRCALASPERVSWSILSMVMFGMLNSFMSRERFYHHCDQQLNRCWKTNAPCHKNGLPAENPPGAKQPGDMPETCKMCHFGLSHHLNHFGASGGEGFRVKVEGGGH